MRCRRCGYQEAEHELETLRCPLCACGKLPAEHVDDGCPCGCGAAPSRHLPLDQTCGCAAVHTCGWAIWAGVPCPGRRSEVSGSWLTLRRGSFELPSEPAPEPERWAVAENDVVLPPQVPVRSPIGSGEIAGAGGKKQATKIGRIAQAAGWSVEALYWRAGDGTEGCALRLARDTVRVVMLWSRKPGHVGETVGWAAAYAYVWRTDAQAFPAKIKHAAVDDLLGTC